MVAGAIAVDVRVIYAEARRRSLRIELLGDGVA
jgi:hypothetical protein